MSIPEAKNSLKWELHPKTFIKPDDHKHRKPNAHITLSLTRRNSALSTFINKKGSNFGKPKFVYPCSSNY